MGATYNGQRFKRKVRDYQKPTQAIKRSKQMKRINDFEFQNQHHDEKRNFTPFGFSSNVNHSGFNHLTLPIQKRSKTDLMYQNGSNYIQMEAPSSYYTPNVDTKNNIQQRTSNQTPNQTNYIASGIDLSRKNDHINTNIQSSIGLGDVGNNSVNTPSKYTQKEDNNIPFTTTKGFQFTEDTNKLILSLDRDLINFISSGGVSIPPPPELLDKTSLKIRRQNVIDALYNKKDKQCPNCGLRFAQEDKTQFDDHLDEHFRQNDELNRTRRGELWNRRKWYPNFAKIKLAETKVQEDDNTKHQPQQKIPMILIDEIMLGLNEDIVKCSLCCEDFEQIFIDDHDLHYKTNFKEKFVLSHELKEGWYLKNAIWSGTEVIHPTCSNEK
jgi:hypothetical protein